jgi:hypothetical protein
MGKTDGIGQTNELDAYRKDLVKALLSELVLIFQAQEKLHGREFANQTMSTFLTSMISTFVCKRLEDATDGAELSADERAKLIAEELEHVQAAVQDSVATGMETGVTAVDPAQCPKYSCSIACDNDGELPALRVVRGGRNT